MVIVVIGGGAAGIFGAIRSAEVNPNAVIHVFEKTSKLLSKVKISGGGRCNVTHSCFDLKQLVTNYPRGHRELLGPFHQFAPKDTIHWFAQQQVPLKTESDGRMFPITDSSQTIIDCLLNIAQRKKVQIHTNISLESLLPISTSNETKFKLIFNNSEEIIADRVLIATGGNPQSKIFNLLQTLGHSIEPLIPSLFTFNCKDLRIQDLQGISVPDSLVHIVGTNFKQHGPLLITHWGFSGPAILKLSAWAANELNKIDYSFKIKINWLGKVGLNDILNKLKEFKVSHPKKKVMTSYPVENFSKRLWESFVQYVFGENIEIKWSDVNAEQLKKLSQEFTEGEFHISGKSTNKDEFVTCGGVKLSEVDFRTMESKLCPGIFFAGEVLNIDGVTGGFNFQSAWTTSWIAGSNILIK